MVGDTTNSPWSVIWGMSALEFLNILCYVRDKEERDKQALEAWKRKH